MLRPINNMIAYPTATVLINGLSIFCHKENSAGMDFGFLKVFSQSDHPFRLRVFRNTALIWSSDFFPKDYFEDSTITITKTNPAGVFGYEHPQGMNNDDRDFRWMLDLATEIYGVDRLPVTHPERLFAKLTIEDGIFYTKLKSVNPAQIVQIGGAGVLPSRYIGRVAAADILCQNGEKIDINITLGGNGNRLNIPLPIFAGQYWIAFDYKCVPDGADDLPAIYDVIEIPVRERYTIYHDPPEVDWTFRGIIANNQSMKYVDECDFADHQTDFPPEYRTYFNSSREAEDARYEPVVHRATEFACQTIGTGSC